MEYIKFAIDLFGGVDTLWLILAILAVTQIAKMLIKAFAKLSADAVRPIPYLAGSLLGLVFIDLTTRGVFVGMACGMISSLSFFAFVSWLEREAAPSWQIKIANRLQLK